MFTSNYDDYTNAMERLVDSEYQIVRVPVRVQKRARYAHCYQNVKKKISLSGGRIQYGWQILTAPWFVLGVHHAVWESDGGDLVDVSPIQPPMSHCMFIPDDRIEDDGSNVIDNVRLNIHNNPVVDDYFAVDGFKNIIMASSPLTDQGAIDIRDVRWPTYKLYAEELSAFIRKGGLPERPCFCASGHSYAACHGPRINAGLARDRRTLPDRVLRIPLMAAGESNPQ